MTAQTVTYRPADPLGVTSVDRLRLYTSPARTGSPAVDVTNAVQQADLSWLFTLPDGITAGVYYARTTVTYTDTSVSDDITDTITLPILAAAQPGDPVAAWVTVAELQTDARLAAAAPDVLAASAQAATDNLWALSGRRYNGLRSARVLILPPPCGCDGAGWAGRSDMWGASSTLGGQRWFPWGWGCGCQVEVHLPDQPVQSIVRVAIDGVTIDPGGYRLDDSGILVRIDGQLWPLLTAGVLAEASPRMEVVYLWGVDAPASGKLAARVYATEIALAAVGSTDCRLPDRVTTITRQDVITTFADPSQLLTDGLTGLTTVDQWIRSVNPRAQTGTRPRVLSPDLPRIRSTT